jgi:hypothetical protein
MVNSHHKQQHHGTITENVFSFPSSFSQNEVHVQQYAFDSRQSTVNSHHKQQHHGTITDNVFLFPHLFPKTKLMSHNMHSTVESQQATGNSKQSTVITSNSTTAP